MFGGISIGPGRELPQVLGPEALLDQRRPDIVAGVVERLALGPGMGVEIPRHHHRGPVVERTGGLGPVVRPDPAGQDQQNATEHSEQRAVHFFRN